MAYRVNEIFYSLQGEGARKGTANIFVRLSGCNLQCSRDGEAGFDCDTEFTSGVRMDTDQLILSMFGAVRSVAGEGARDVDHSVILTGGEPGMQVDHELISALKGAGFFIAVETNGTYELPQGIDWISCSPKTAEHTLRVGDVSELRYVRNTGQGIPKPSLNALHHFLSPAAQADGTIDRESLAHCTTLCLENPKWSLSVQDHKTWGLR